MNETEQKNWGGRLEAYDLMKQLIAPDLEYGDSIRKQHAQIILDSTRNLENMTRIELGESIDKVYAQLRVGRNK